MIRYQENNTALKKLKIEKPKRVSQIACREKNIIPWAPNVRKEIS